MNINQTLIEKTKSPGWFKKDLLKNYGCRREDVEEFLLKSHSLEDRQDKAIAIIEYIFRSHGKTDLIHHVSRLAKTEHGIRELQPWQRDHVAHAMLCFILGIYLNEFYLRGIVDKFEWKIAGLLHDIAYPVEFSKNLISAVPEDINTIAHEIGCVPPQLRSVTKIEGLENLKNGVSGLDLIQKRVQSWGINIEVQSEYKKMQNENPCHGMYSSLAVLLVIDMMYEYHNPLREHKDIRAVEPDINWNQHFFENDIVNACSAIFLHNLSPSHFQSTRISRTKAPLAFLLKLCDSLQEWERPSKDNPIGLSADSFDIGVKDGKIVYSANISENIKKKIRGEILSSIDEVDIFIR